jgi:Ca2+-binding EF-hand superfamily protein
MKEYMQSVDFKKTTLTLMASRIPEDQVKQLREAFEMFDKNGDGRLTLQELRDGMKNVKGVSVSDDDVD